MSLNEQQFVDAVPQTADELKRLGHIFPRTPFLIFRTESEDSTVLIFQYYFLNSEEFVTTHAC